MTVLYIHQYFKTPEEGGAIRSYHLARGMVEAGHDVVMLTAHDRTEKEIRNMDGITVHYLPVAYSNVMGKESRISAFMKFARLAIKEAQTINADIAYVSSTPLTVGLIALYLKFFKTLPYIFEVRDLWPEAPIQMGAIRNSLLKKALRKLEKRIYKNAEAVIALSPGMEAGVRKAWPGTDVYMVPNFSDCDYFICGERGVTLISKYWLSPDDFIISYIGTVGPANGLDHLLQMAAACKKEHPQVKFIVCGEGAEKERLQKDAENKKLSNLLFLPAIGKNEVRELLNISDATLCLFKDLPILQTNSPNKFFDSLAAGRMVIVNTEGWLKQLVENNACGFYTAPGHAQDFPVTLAPFIENRQKAREHGSNARRLAEKQFDKREMKDKVISVLNSYAPAKRV